MQLKLWIVLIGLSLILLALGGWAVQGVRWLAWVPPRLLGGWAVEGVLWTLTGWRFQRRPAWSG